MLTPACCLVLVVPVHNDYMVGKYPHLWVSGRRGKLGELFQLAGECGIVGVGLGAFE